jgi:hypothetical protein
MRLSIPVATLASLVCLTFSASVARAGEVSGPYATRLSQADVTQIKAAVRSEQGIPHNVRKIEAMRPDKVAIQTGGKRGLNMEIYYDFTVSKRAGKWAVDANSVQITDEPTNNHRLDSDATGR